MAPSRAKLTAVLLSILLTVNIGNRIVVLFWLWWPLTIVVGDSFIMIIVISAFFNIFQCWEQAGTL